MVGSGVPEITQEELNSFPSQTRGAETVERVLPATRKPCFQQTRGLLKRLVYRPDTMMAPLGQCAM